MAFRKWRKELQRLAFIILFSGTTGYFLDTNYSAHAVATALLLYIIWLFYQFNKLHRWLRHPQNYELPESDSIWGKIFDLTYELHYQKEKMKHQLLATVNRAQSSTNALAEGIVILDSQSNLEWWNKSANHLVGFRFPNDKGRQITNLLRDPTFIHFFEKMPEQQEFIQIKSPTKENCFLEVRIAIFGQNQRILVIRDITRIKQLEQIRSDFIANVSHELRTPITVISGFIETFLAQANLFSPKILKGLNHMQEQAQRMQKLVNNLMFLVKLESTDANPAQEIISVESIITATIRAASLMNYGARILKLHVDPTLSIYGNYIEIESALSNLIHNAFKYSNINDTIEITAQQKEGRAQVEIKDTGAGISPNEITRITERFYRVDKSRQSQTGGTGLGLAIVKHVLQRHDASLEIQSKLGEGSTFTCIFPEKRGRKIAGDPHEELA